MDVCTLRVCVRGRGRQRETCNADEFFSRTCAHVALERAISFNAKTLTPNPNPLCQVALEGAISRKAASSSLARGELPQGDLIPWTVGQQYQDPGADECQLEFHS